MAKTAKSKPVYWMPRHQAKLEWFLDETGQDYSSFMRRIALERITEFELATGIRFTDTANQVKEPISQ